MAKANTAERKSIFSLFNLIALIVLGMGIYITYLRFTGGLAAVTNLSDYNPWGIWIGFDLLVGVALAAGGGDVHLDKANIDLDNKESLQRGAKLVVIDPRLKGILVHRVLERLLGPGAAGAAERIDARITAVTGTNGKTTTATLIREILAAAGWSAGLLTTLRYDIGERSIPAVRTTPAAPDMK